MHLTNILLRWKKRLPRGHIFRGKYRLYKKVTPEDLNDLKLKFQQEELNMFYLRHPYLTLEQSSGHAKELGKYAKFMDNKIRSKTWEEHKYLGDRLGFLKTTESWDKD